MSYLEKDKNKQPVLLAVSPAECGANKISRSFVGNDKNQPSDAVSQLSPDAFGYTSVPSALHLSHPFSIIYECAIFRNQVLTNIWRSAPPPSQWEAQETVKAEAGFMVLTAAWKWQGVEHNRNAEDSN